MIIRREQMQALKEAADHSFEAAMVQHIRQFAPANAKVIGDEGVRDFVRLGLRRARDHGFTCRGPLRFYLESMIAFGSHFDADPQLPWVSEVLADHTARDEMIRAERLWAGTRDYYDRVMGPGNAYGIKALRRVVEESAESFSGAGDLEGKLLIRLRSTYPEKYHYIGERVGRTLIERGREVAGTHRVGTEFGVALIVGLMFGFGHGVITDPLYPWVGRTLADPRGAGPDARSGRLHDKVKTYLRRVLANLERGDGGPLSR